METNSSATNPSTDDDFSELAIRRGFDVWMYLAYSSLLMSYVNINILIFRFWLTFASIWFVVWGFIPERSVQIDTVVYNLIYVIINIVYCIPLIKKYLPAKLTPFEKEIYERDFNGNMSEKQFKFMIKRFESESVYAKNTQLCRAGNTFKYLIYIAKIHPGWRVNLIGINDELMIELREGSWIGIIEYVNYEQSLKEKKPSEGPQEITWGVTATVEQLEEDTNRINSVTEEKLIDRSKGGVVVYYFSPQVNFEST